MTATPSEPGATAASRRVILLGRTGLDRALRTDHRVELIRAADTFEAIGELADPIDDASPQAAVVVVAPDSAPDGPERAAFLGALRAIDPHVAVLLAAANGDTLGCDALIDPDASGEDLERIVAGLNGRVATNGHAAAPAHRPRTAPPAPAHDDADASVLEAVLHGQDPLAPALAAVRARLGREDADYVRGSDAPPGPSAPVRAGEVTLGHLVLTDTTAPTPDLAPHAAWLSRWLRLHEQQRQLRHAAFTDPLTGAWNRRYFDRYLEAAIEQVRNARLPLTVMVFDIDDFKAYNDRFGHASGDEILVETVRLLRSVIRPSDRVCRIGGDEFAVVFYEPAGPRSAASKPPESVYVLAKRFQRQICDHRFPKLGAEAQGTLTISGGLATFPWDGTDAATLLARADELALQSKRQGKNVITLGPGAESVCRPEKAEQE